MSARQTIAEQTMPRVTEAAQRDMQMALNAAIMARNIGNLSVCQHHLKRLAVLLIEQNMVQAEQVFT